MMDTIHVLHVDDEPEFANLVTTYLEHIDDRLDVETAYCAREGLDHLRTNGVDCIVSDHDMPETNGIDFLRAVREDAPDLPFILFTGKGSEEVASEAISAGVTDYLQKGADSHEFELLANRIRNAVTQYRSGRAQQVLVELAENTQKTLWVYLPDFSKVLFVSPAYEAVWGRSIAALYDHPTDFLDGVHPDDRDNVQDAMAAVAGGETIEIEFRVNAAEGYRRWVRVRGEPILDETGTVVRIAGFGTDITEEHRRRERRDRQRDTLLELATDEAVTTGDFETAIERITETSAAVLDVARVNVWLLDDDGDGDRMTCVDAYDQATDEHTNGMALATDAYPAYVAALETNRAIAADDAREDPRTAELTEDYLDVHDIGALLDATLWSEGKVIGVICHEHVGGPRAWAEDEVEYASDIADVVNRAVRNRERREREAQLRNASSRLEALLEDSPDMIDVIDADGTILDVNRRFCEELGYDKDEVLGRSIWEFDQLVDADDVDSIIERLALGERRKFEARAVRRDGSTLPVEVHLIRLDIDGENQYLSLSRDITERKAYERQLERQNERLDEFSSVVSHDLKNPLAVARGYLELAREASDSEYLDRVTEALERMEALIDDLLTLARENTKSIDVGPVDLADFCVACWRNVETRNASLVTDTDRTILADSSRLQHLLENLLRNAVEHGGEDVTVTVGELDDGFYVEDDGPGIPSSARFTVFEAGYSTAEEGTGFGLSIVAQVAEAHRWDVRATEGSDGGARFEVTGVGFADE